MANQKYFRKIGLTTIIGFSVVLGISSLLYSEEPSEKPRSHVSGNQFQPGDIISADILNELFERLNDLQVGFSSPKELVGTWSCDSFQPSVSIDRAVEGWTLSEDGMYMSLTGSTITFSDNGDGTFSLTTSAPDPLFFTNPGPHSSPYQLISNWVIFHTKFLSVESLQHMMAGIRLKRLVKIELLLERNLLEVTIH